MSEEITQKFSDVIFYSSPEGKIHVEVVFSDETFWLTGTKMADLFGTSKQNVAYHLQNIYKEKELDAGSTVKEILTVQKRRRK